MNEKTKKIVGIGLLTAIIIVLQVFAISIRFGVFNITLVLTPIIVGAALYGWKTGAWLGFVFGFVVLFTDAGVFLAISIPGTIITVLAKGILAGLVAAFVYTALEKKNRYLAILVAAIATPMTNTGIFLLGCYAFFLETIKGWAASAGFENAGSYMIFGLVGINFVVELIINLILSTATLRIVNIGKKNVA